MARQVNVFRIEYERMPNMDQWTACIGAFTHEEAVEQLFRRIGRNINITSSGIATALDDLSYEVRDAIYPKVGALKVMEEPATPAEEVGEFKSGRGRKPQQ